MSEEKKSGLAAAAAKLKAAKAKKKAVDAAENSRSIKNDAADNPNLVSGIANAARRFKRED